MRRKRVGCAPCRRRDTCTRPCPEIEDELPQDRPFETLPLFDGAALQDYKTVLNEVTDRKRAEHQRNQRLLRRFEDLRTRGILAMLDSGIRVSDISLLLRLDESTIYKLLKRAKEAT